MKLDPDKNIPLVEAQIDTILLTPVGNGDLRSYLFTDRFVSKKALVITIAKAIFKNVELHSDN